VNGVACWKGVIVFKVDEWDICTFNPSNQHDKDKEEHTKCKSGE